MLRIPFYACRLKAKLRRRVIELIYQYSPMLLFWAMSCPP